MEILLLCHQLGLKFLKLLELVILHLCFINKSFSKKFSSPTKVAESLACGVPVIYNEGIGDLNNDMKEMNLGF